MKKILYIIAGVFIALVLPACAGGGGSAGAGDHEAHDAHGDEHGEAVEVELSQAQMDAVGIKLGNIELRDMEDLVSTTGVLEVAPQSEAVVAPKLPGTVSRILVSPGQRVERGAVVAYIESPELLSLAQEFGVARTETEAARIEFERQEALDAQGAGVRKNLDYARSQFNIAQQREQGLAARIRAYGVAPSDRLSSGTYPLKAEISGTVTQVSAGIGSFADMQAPVARIVDSKAVYCKLLVLEKDIDRIRKGSAVELSLINNSAAVIAGEVQEINPVLEEGNRSIPVIVKLMGERPDVPLIPGMAVSGRIFTGENRAEAVPEEAVVRSGGRSFIFVLEDEHEEDGQKMYHFEKVEVVSGNPSMGYVAVKPMTPLDPDARIVTSGAFYLNSMSTEHGEHSH